LKQCKEPLASSHIKKYILIFNASRWQTDKLTPNLKATAFQVQTPSLCYHSRKSSSNSSSVNKKFLTKMVGWMLKLEWVDKRMKPICFIYYKEGHTTHDCSWVFPYKKKWNLDKIQILLNLLRKNTIMHFNTSNLLKKLSKEK
jgi:hypothetical protein